MSPVHVPLPAARVLTRRVVKPVLGTRLSPQRQRRVIAEIDQIISNAAKGIETTGRLAQGQGQKL